MDQRQTRAWTKGGCREDVPDQLVRVVRARDTDRHASRDAECVSGLGGPGDPVVRHGDDRHLHAAGHPGGHRSAEQVSVVPVRAVLGDDRSAAGGKPREHSDGVTRRDRGPDGQVAPGEVRDPFQPRPDDLAPDQLRRVEVQQQVLGPGEATRRMHHVHEAQAEPDLSARATAQSSAARPPSSPRATEARVPARPSAPPAALEAWTHGRVVGQT